MSKSAVISLIFSTIFVLSCTITKKVKLGEDAYQLKQFAVAVDLLTNEYQSSNSAQTKANKAFLLGECYSKLYKAKESLHWYIKSNELGYGEKSLDRMAFAYKKVERYEDAIKCFDELYKITKLNRYKKEIAVCKEVKQWKKLNADRYRIESLDSNSEFAEYSPVIFEDKFVVFSSDRVTSTGDQIYEWTGKDYSDLFIMTQKGSSIYSFEASFNTKSNEGAACFNNDYTEIFFTRCVSISTTDEYCRIYYSNRDAGYWTEPRPLIFFDEDINYGHPTLIENDSVLIFSVETDKYNNSHDLFYSIRASEGWSKPESMPSSINTEGDEVFPSSDGDTLYFSSNFHNGMGGLDIFKTYLKEDNSWTKPINLQSPINSGADDFSLAIKRKTDASLLSGFFTTNRNGTDDIFEFDQLVNNQGPLTDTIIADTLEEIIDKEYFLAVKVVEGIRKNNNPNEKLIAKKPLQEANLKLIGDGIIERLELDQNAVSITEVVISDQIKLKAELLGYLSSSKEINVSKYDNDSKTITINVELILEKIQYNKEIILDNIYYDFNRWNIRNDAAPVLGSLIQILMENPMISIELGSHTDCRGDDDFNIDLSQKRAKSVVEYLSKNGVENSRLVAVGYGETKPLNTCLCQLCSEDEHQRNRRTSFIILEDN